mgnify:CR=1 FL=1
MKNTIKSLTLNYIDIIHFVPLIIDVLMTGGTLTIHMPGDMSVTTAGIWNPERRRVSFGNGKTEIPSISTFAGCGFYNGAVAYWLKPLFRAVGAVGSCNCDCNGCYAKSMTRIPGVSLMYLLNTLECRINPVRFYDLCMHEILSEMPGVERVRIHDSGDFMTVSEYLTIEKLCMEYPGINFATYTKRSDIVTRGLTERRPDNLILSGSPWYENGACKCPGLYPDLCQQFIYDDGTVPELAKLPHCPAVNLFGERTGITCNRCRWCYTRHDGKRRAVYAHDTATRARWNKRIDAAFANASLSDLLTVAGLLARV